MVSDPGEEKSITGYEITDSDAVIVGVKMLSNTFTAAGKNVIYWDFIGMDIFKYKTPHTPDVREYDCHHFLICLTFNT